MVIFNNFSTVRSLFDCLSSLIFLIPFFRFYCILYNTNTILFIILFIFFKNTFIILFHIIIIQVFLLLKKTNCFKTNKNDTNWFVINFSHFLWRICKLFYGISKNKNKIFSRSVLNATYKKKNNISTKNEIINVIAE